MHFADSIVIFLLALILFGPKKLPEVARQVGKLMMEFRRASNEFKSQIDDELRAMEQQDRRFAQLGPGRRDSLVHGVVGHRKVVIKGAALPFFNSSRLYRFFFQYTHFFRLQSEFRTGMLKAITSGSQSIRRGSRRSTDGDVATRSSFDGSARRLVAKNLLREAPFLAYYKSNQTSAKALARCVETPFSASQGGQIRIVGF